MESERKANLDARRRRREQVDRGEIDLKTILANLHSQERLGDVPRPRCEKLLGPSLDAISRKIVDYANASTERSSSNNNPEEEYGVDLPEPLSDEPFFGIGELSF